MLISSPDAMWPGDGRATVSASFEMTPTCCTSCPSEGATTNVSGASFKRATQRSSAHAITPTLSASNGSRIMASRVPRGMTHGSGLRASMGGHRSLPEQFLALLYVKVVSLSLSHELLIKGDSLWRSPGQFRQDFCPLHKVEVVRAVEQDGPMVLLMQRLSLEANPLDLSMYAVFVLSFRRITLRFGRHLMCFQAWKATAKDRGTGPNFKFGRCCEAVLLWAPRSIPPANDHGVPLTPRRVTTR